MKSYPSALAAVTALVTTSGCNLFDHAPPEPVDAGASSTDCARHSDCGPEGTHACVLPEGRCVAVASEDCTLASGSLRDDRTLLLGALTATSGPQRATNLVREQSVILAVEELNAQGGVPGSQGARPVALVACDSARDLEQAGTHLVRELAVPAIVGPNNSQDVLTLTHRLSASAGTLLISPTAVAASIGDLIDNDLTFTVVPSDEQRAPLLARRVAMLEAELVRQRGGPLKLSMIYRDDALGHGTRAGLVSLDFNGRKLVDDVGDHVRLAPYDPGASEHGALIAQQAEFRPDIVVLAGPAESITQILEPLERALPAAAPRPHYVLIDSGKVPELLALVRAHESLRRRVRGIGVAPDPRSSPVFASFASRFERRFPESSAAISGAGPAYDATYALAYAIAASAAEPLRGDAIARGLRRLGSGAEVEVGPTQLARAFGELRDGRAIFPIGTFAPLAWDARGGNMHGVAESWCIRGGAEPTFQGAGETYTTDSRMFAGEERGCDEPPGATPALDAGTPASGPADAGSAVAPRDAAASDGAAAPSGGSMPATMDGGSAAGDGAAACPTVAPPPAVEAEGLIVRVGSATADPHDPLVTPTIQIDNESNAPLPIGSLRVRYYLQNEHSSTCPRGCRIDAYWSGILPSGNAIPTRHSYVSVGCKAAYLQIDFPGATPALAPGQRLELQQGFHTDTFAAMDETNDYSYCASRTPQRSSKVTVYRDGALVWGAPPY